METTPAPGTTLEVLAPYLPYQLDVFVARDPQSLSGGHGRLIGLLPDRRGQHQATVGYAGAEGTAAYNDRALAGQWVSLHRILPVLRPFSQLCDPLPDGTVPAVEVAKLCWGPELNNYELRAEYIASWMDDNGDMHHSEPRVEVSGVLLEDPDYTLCFCILPDWTWYEAGGYDNEAPVATVDYLRSKHFALPVNGRPLIAGIDYIEKAATPASGREGEGHAG